MLTCILDSVQDVARGLQQQLGVASDGALNPINQIVRQVTGGVWRGRGADAFVNELTSLVIPGIENFLDISAGFNTNIFRALDIMNQADSAVSTSAVALGDVFDAIINF